MLQGRSFNRRHKPVEYKLRFKLWRTVPTEFLDKFEHLSAYITLFSHFFLDAGRCWPCVVMHALHQELVPPSGVEFLASLKLTHSTIKDPAVPVSARHELAARVLCNAVVARSNILRIFEVREELAQVSGQYEEERERKGKTRKDTESVEGETSMEGDGYVNIAKVIHSNMLVYITCMNSMFGVHTLTCVFSQPTKRQVCPPLPSSTFSASTVCMESSLAWHASRSCPRWRTSWTVCLYRSEMPRCVYSSLITAQRDEKQTARPFGMVRRDARPHHGFYSHIRTSTTSGTRQYHLLYSANRLCR